MLYARPDSISVSVPSARLDVQPAGQRHADVMDLAPLGTRGCPDVIAPVPARLVVRAAERLAADAEDLEFAVGEGPNLVRRSEVL